MNWAGRWLWGPLRTLELEPEPGPSVSVGVDLEPWRFSCLVGLVEYLAAVVVVVAVAVAVEERRIETEVEVEDSVELGP